MLNSLAILTWLKTKIEPLRMAEAYGRIGTLPIKQGPEETHNSAKQSAQLGLPFGNAGLEI